MKKALAFAAIVTIGTLLALTAFAAGSTIKLNGVDRELVVLDEFTSGTAAQDWTGGGGEFVDGKLKNSSGWMGWGRSDGTKTDNGVLTAEGQAKLANVEYLVFDIYTEMDAPQYVAIRFSNATTEAAAAQEGATGDEYILWDTATAVGEICYIVDGDDVTEVQIEITEDGANCYVELPAGFNGKLVVPVSTLAYWDETLTALGFVSLFNSEFYVDTMYGIYKLGDQPSPEPTEDPAETGDPATIGYALTAFLAMGAVALRKRSK